MGWIYLLLILCITALVAFPYERIAVKRFLTMKKIARLCKEKNINFKIMNRVYPFSKNKRNEFDCIMRVGKTVIPIKFFSATDSRSTIIFDRSGKLCISRSYRKPISKADKAEYKTVKHYGKLPSMRISKKIIGERYRCFPIFLNEPSFRQTLMIDESKRIHDFYDLNEKVAGCNFISADTLPELLSIYTSEEE